MRATVASRSVRARLFSCVVSLASSSVRASVIFMITVLTHRVTDQDHLETGSMNYQILMGITDVTRPGADGQARSEAAGYAERACGCASATSMISLCSSCATAL